MRLCILDKNNQVRAEEQGEEELSLLADFDYEEGDHIVWEPDPIPAYYVVQLDDVLGESFSYATGTVDFLIPWGDQSVSYSPRAFTGKRHYLYVRKAEKEEITAYRNLALNVNDAHGDTHLYPHVTANAETRGAAAFAARNVVDGVVENRSHGDWPFESWGINMREDAELTIDFGHEVETGRIVLYTRADFPHDNWWEQVTFFFSDGSSLDYSMEKSQKPHVVTFPPKRITSMKMGRLLKADDPSPFPSLSQIQVWGKIVE